MTPRPPPNAAELPLIVGIECGATRTSVLAVRGDKVLTQFQLGPANVLLPEGELLAHFAQIGERLPKSPLALGIGMAAARTEEHCTKIREIAGRVWPSIPVHGTSDLETALAAAKLPARAAGRVLVLSGTGSCCFGKAKDGRTAKVGGRGHVIGDRASAADIGRQALRAVVALLDRTGHWGPLGVFILESLAMNHPEELIPWSMKAGKAEIAALAVAVFRAAERGDATARAILNDAAASLADDAVACAQLLLPHGEPVHFLLNGGVLVPNPEFAKEICQKLRKRRPGSTAAPLERPSVWGAVELARAMPRDQAISVPQTHVPQRAALIPAWTHDLTALAQSPTERRNPLSMTFDRMPLAQAASLMLDEDAGIAGAIRAEIRQIVRVTQAIIQAFRQGGRLFYAGAGTSGRLGVLDASEIPPTFRAPPDLVQGLIAGGQPALWSAVEGAEDDAAAGASAAAFRNIGSKDVLVGIAASGRTPFVWGCLTEAAHRGAFTALLTFNPAVKVLARRQVLPKVVIAPDLGPEILTGSTRLKCGTATKLILNIFTTLAMTKLGKVAGNLMIDLNPSNIKLRDRAVRIVQEMTKVTAEKAELSLEESNWSVPKALRRLGRKS